MRSVTTAGQAAIASITLRCSVAALGLGVLFQGTAHAALDPDKPLSRPTQSIWNTTSGLPHNSVLALAQTPDGYLWIGTEEGLARFDGVRFTVFDTANTPGLLSNHISCLLSDRQGDLWIGTQGGGLVQNRHGRIIRTFTTKSGLLSDTILSLFEDRSGSLWIGTPAGLSLLSRRVLRTYTTKDGLPDDSVFALAGQGDGKLWIGTHSGLASLHHGRITVYGTKDGLIDKYIKCLRLTRSGDLWVGTNDGGLFRFIDGHFQPYRQQQGVGSNSIWAIYEDSRRTVWLGTADSGLSMLANGKSIMYSKQQGLPSDRVFAFLEDRQGSFWIATGGGGLVRLTNGLFSTLTNSDGLSNDVILPVFEDASGTIWAGTDGGGVNVIDAGNIRKITTKNGLADNLVFSIAQDVAGGMWISTRKGLDRLTNGRFKLFTQKDGLPSDVVLCLYRDSEGTLWAGSRGGLSRFDGRRFKTYTTRDGLSSNYVVSLYEDASHVLWIGTGGGGLDQFRKDRFTTYPLNNKLSSKTVWSIAGDPDGALWIGTAGGGLNRIKNGKVTAYTVADGLFDNELLQILQNGDGYLWISSNKGVFRVPKSQLNAFADGRIGRVQSIPYGIEDGLKTTECNGGFQPSGWVSRDGRMLFPTMRGLAIADTRRVNEKRPIPVVVIESVTIDGTATSDVSASLRAKPGEGRLEFTFSAPSLVDAASIRFRYRLAGFDKNWIDAGQRRTAYYTNIPPGAYRFEVSASSLDQSWQAAPASIGLSLAPHFYQTKLFLLLCLAAVLGSSLGFYHLRMRQIRRNEERLVSLIDEKTKALQEQIRAKERANAELAQAQQSLMELSRRSGMAEVATGVLHNVGNVLNSVNVGAALVASKVKESRVDNVLQAVQMLQSNASHLSDFVQSDPKGQRLLPYLGKLALHLRTEREDLIRELEGLTGHVEHIKEIVATQQDYAKASALKEIVSVPKVLTQALAMVEASLSRHHVEVLLQLEDVPEIATIKHKLVEILVNLIRNAKQAVIEQNGPIRQVQICIRRKGEDRIRIEVHDTGVGLSSEHLTQVFAHGFTTKRDGHGFGLHSGALSARQMGGSLWAESDGPGRGASFILELPVTSEINEPVAIAT